MRLLSLSQLRFLRFAPWSTLTVLIGITLAVSSIVAVHQISQRVVSSLEAVTPPYLRAISYLLERPGLNMDDYFSLRARWRAGEIPELRGLMPMVEGSVVIAEQSRHVIGLDAFSGITETLGLALVPPGELIVGADRGDELVLGGQRYPIALSLPALPADMIVTDIGTAQAMLGLPDAALSRIAVIVHSPGARLLKWSDRLLPGFSAGLRLPGWSLPDWQVRSLESDLPSLSFARSVLFNLGALGSLALVVAWLLVYQVGVIWLRRRQLTLTRLRQMGVSEAELRFGFLLSLTVLGLVACALGILLGDLLADGLARAATGYGAFENSPGLDGWLLIKAVGSAALVCLVGGWFAYAGETRAAPSPVRYGLSLSLIAGLGMAGIWLSDSLFGGFVSIAAAGLLVLAAIGPLLRWLQGVSRHLRGHFLARVGLRELVWYPGDLAVAVGALVLALATSVAISLMVDSFRVDFESMLDQRMVDDLFVDGQGRDLSGLAAQLQLQEDVRRVQAYGRADVLVAGVKVSLGYSQMDAQESARYGLDRALRVDEAVISERLARSLHVQVGDGLPVLGSNLAVVAVFAGFGDPMPRLLVHKAALPTLGLRARVDRLSISSGRPLALMAVIRQLDPEVEVQQRLTLREAALRIFDQTFAITQALTLLALIVASVGLYNALLALQLLQQPARVLLRSMGVTRAELRTVDRWRVAGVGLAAVLIALPLGLIMGWLLCQVINPRAFGWSLNLLVKWPSLVWPVLSALAAMALVALFPTPAEGVEHPG